MRGLQNLTSPIGTSLITSSDRFSNEVFAVRVVLDGYGSLNWDLEGGFESWRVLFMLSGDTLQEEKRWKIPCSPAKR
jgi:hypothetical protein